ncbi:hypothetical protein [Terrabacter sp. Root85]|uniref:hypothetical protein n=1 Tax=Terrabacter sp. Root85 TaxID=1736603 RepID=UPI000AE3AD43|nr:hypothetical protein [Terrabacter sp. Root85]
MDARHRLALDPFDWQRTASGQIRVSRGGRLEDAVQHALARATGNYRPGNER